MNKLTLPNNHSHDTDTTSPSAVTPVVVVTAGAAAAAATPAGSMTPAPAGSVPPAPAGPVLSMPSPTSAPSAPATTVGAQRSHVLGCRCLTKHFLHTSRPQEHRTMFRSANQPATPGTVSHEAHLLGSGGVAAVVLVSPHAPCSEWLWHTQTNSAMPEPLSGSWFTCWYSRTSPAWSDAHDVCSIKYLRISQYASPTSCWWLGSAGESRGTVRVEPPFGTSAFSAARLILVMVSPTDVAFLLAPSRNACTSLALSSPRRWGTGIFTPEATAATPDAIVASTLKALSNAFAGLVGSDTTYGWVQEHVAAVPSPSRDASHNRYKSY
eukprot:m.183862 g.183862  ORF g.183862 m.183862 type:complete len:324 (+) comp18088_c0_seq1:3509-4480(+)